MQLCELDLVAHSFVACLHACVVKVPNVTCTKLERG
jgi:hypothetical protein